jgi:hypothetical protein
MREKCASSVEFYPMENVTATATDFTRRDADHALTHELAGRLRRLARHIEHTYAPALRRLAASDEPGAGSAYAELEETFEESLDWFRRHVAGIAYAAGDADLCEYHELGLDLGRLLPGERSDAEVMAELAESGDRDVAERYARYLAGKAKATQMDPEEVA